MTGPFLSADDGMTAFLQRLAKGNDDTAIFARNFLLDEGVVQARLASYANSGAAAAHPDPDTWAGRHVAYLKDKVFVPGASGEPPARIDAEDPDLCPETFRHFDSPYAQSTESLHLVRVEAVAGIADLVEGWERRDIIQAAEAALAGKPNDLERLLGLYSRKADWRPVFAGFWEDVADLFDENNAPQADDWADQLRDRLGLAHHDPARTGGPIDVLVFRYPVARVPRLEGLGADEYPLVPPTVLDSRFSSAFCPAPHGCATGHTVHLSDPDCDRVCRELLHPALRFRASELLALGAIRQPVEAADTISAARDLHLECLRQHYRADYGHAVEGSAR